MIFATQEILFSLYMYDADTVNLELDTVNLELFNEP